MSIFSEQTTSSTLLAYARIIVTGLFLSCVCESAFFWVKHGAGTLEAAGGSCITGPMLCTASASVTKESESVPSRTLWHFQDRSVSAILVVKEDVLIIFVEQSDTLIQKASLMCSVSLKERILHTESKPQPKMHK